MKAWLARHPRWHIHFIPTYSSWPNQVERFFGLITEKAIRRGSFGSVKDLVGKIEHFVAQYNKHSQPFVWTASADSILEKLERLTSRISGTAHYLVDVLQRISGRPASRVAELTPRIWKKHFAASPLRSALHSLAA